MDLNRFAKVNFVSYCSTILVRKVKSTRQLRVCSQGSFMLCMYCIECYNWVLNLFRKFFSKIYSFLKMQTKAVLLHSWTVSACVCKTKTQMKIQCLHFKANEALQVSPHCLPSTRGSILAVPNWIILYFQQTVSHAGQSPSGLVCFSLQMSRLSPIPILQNSCQYSFCMWRKTVCRSKHEDWEPAWNI